MPEKPFSSTPLLHDQLTDAGARAPWAWTLVPAIALGTLAFALSCAPLPLPLGVSNFIVHRAGTPVVSATGDWVVPASETLVVARHSTQYVLLRGNLQQPLGTPLLAPQGGQVAQVLAHPGEAVRAGQPLLEISRGVESARSDVALPPPGISRAERDQVSAERQGQAAQSRVKQAHARLDAAQQRVQAAQQRVARAQDLVRRLQNGETVGSEELSTPVATPAPEKPANSPQPNEARLAVQREKALRESQRQESRATAAERAAGTAERAAEAAETNAHSKQKLAQSAQSALDDLRAAARNSASERTKPDAPEDAAVKDQPDKNKVADSDAPSTPGHIVGLRAAQNRAEAAQAAATEAQSRAKSLRREADKAQSLAADLRAQANDATRNAISALQNLQVFDNEKNATTTLRSASTPAAARANSSSDTSSHKGEKITAREAVRIVRAAVAESEAAVTAADRIRHEVESLDRPVSTTARRVVSSKKRFDAAQQQMWSVARTERPNVTQVMAPEAGVILWIAELAREVESGEPLGAIGRTDRMEVVLRDTSGAWKSAKVGAKILALVQPMKSDAPHIQPTSATASTSTPIKTHTVLNPGAALRGVPTLARILLVTPPAHAGAPAFIKIAVHNPRHASTVASKPSDSGKDADYGMAARVFTPGTPVVCSLSKPAAGPAQIVVPTAAIRRDSARQALVAVLAPETGRALPADACRVEWRKVQLGRGDGFQNVVLAGLKIGDRIALRPDAIYNFTLSHGAQATLRVERA